MCSLGEEAGRRVLDILQFLKMSVRQSVEEAIVVVECDECMHDDCSC